MKIIIGGVATLIMLVAMVPSTFAITAYRSGYKHGLTDGKNSCIRPGADQDKCDGNHNYVSHPLRQRSLLMDTSSDSYSIYIRGYPLYIRSYKE